MKSVFIRHKLASKSEILDDLWTKRLIALHYQNIRSVNPAHYSGAGQKALKRLWSYCETGGIVGATYADIQPGKMIIGIIEAGSRVEWTDAYGEDFIYKIVQLSQTQVISLGDYPLLAAIRPRNVAISGWPSAQPYLNALLGRGQIQHQVQSLAPSQLEVLCYEYLRSTESLKALLLPIGRGLPDVDIYGLAATGRYILAQVTQSRNRGTIRKKMEQLKRHAAPNKELIFFGPKDFETDDVDVQYLSIERVFQALEANFEEPILQSMISEMLNWKIRDS